MLVQHSPTAKKFAVKRTKKKKKNKQSTPFRNLLLRDESIKPQHKNKTVATIAVVGAKQVWTRLEKK